MVLRSFSKPKIEHVGERIACCAVESADIPYSIPNINALEDSGMHITKNPEFGYTH